MNKIFVIGLVAMLSGTMFLPAVIGSNDKDMGDKATVKVRTSFGVISERELSSAEVIRMQLEIEQINNHVGSYEKFLPSLLGMLEDYGLVKNAEKMELAIKGSVASNKSPNQLFFNTFCFVAGYGHGSMLVTPAMLLTPIVPLPISMLIFYYQTLRPRLFVPLGGWLVAEGEMSTVGMLGYQHYSIGVGNSYPMPNCILLVGFTGLWISILKKGVENEYFVGSAIAVFGG